MIGIIIIYGVVFIATIAMGYHLRRCIKDKRIAEKKLEKAVHEAFDDGYKKGFADGEQQVYSDGKMFSQIAAHNESVLRKQGVIK